MPLSIVIVRRLARAARSDRLTPALAAAAWPAFFMTLRYGQISTVALFALAVALWLDVRDRHFAAGLVLGCLVYKPTLVAVPVLVFLAAGQWSLLAGVAAAAGAETLVAVWLVGAGPFDQYVHILVSLAAAPDTIQLFPAESHSIRGFVRLLAPFEPAVRIATALGLVGAVAAAAWVWRSLDDRRLRWAALTLAMAAGSPHLLTYDLVLLAVPLMLVYDWLASDPRPDPVEFWALATRPALRLRVAGGPHCAGHPCPGVDARDGPRAGPARRLLVAGDALGRRLALLQQAQHQLVGRQAEERVVDGCPP